MKQIIFKVSSPKEKSIVSLIKEINKISCRIQLDFENGLVTVKDVNDNMIDMVIELVNNYYTILGVDIDNIFEEPLEEQAVQSVEESETSTTVETVIEKQPAVSEPQSEDDLIIKKVEFENKYLETLVNKLLKTASWAMFKKDVPEKHIAGFIYSCLDEISMTYSPNEVIKFSIGDIVECNYGTHMYGEINGTHVHGIVCNILNEDMAYVIPITKVTGSEITSKSYLEFTAPKDALYNNEYYKGGTALLDKGKYIRVERFKSVIGRTTPAFFEKMLYKLSSTFDFTDYIVKTDEEVVDSTMNEITEEVVYEDNEAVIENSNSEATVASEPTDVSVDSKISTDKVGREEAGLLEFIGCSFDKLDKTKSVEEQLESFLNEIGMPTDSKLISQSFIIACDIKKINYENVILELHNMNPNMKENSIKASLQEIFKNWLNSKYPKLAEKCPKISLMSMLRVFAKRFREDNNC